MKVLVLAPQLDRPETGIGRYVHDAVAGLVAVGAEPWVACRRAGAPRAEASGVRTDRITIVPDPVPWETLATLAGRPLRAAHPDVVHGTRHVVPLGGRAATVLTVHDLVAASPPTGVRSLRRLLLPRAFGASVGRADLLLPTTPAGADELVAARPEVAAKVRTVPVAVRSALAGTRPRAVADLDPDRPLALHVGDHDPRKNVDLLVEVWPEVAAATGAQLVLVGSRHTGSSPPPGLGALVAAGSARDLGRVDDQQLRWLYDHARVAVVCSTSEGYGYPVLDAVALGCPLLTSPVPALDDVGSTTEPGDVHTLDPHDRDAWVEPLREALGRARQPAAGPAADDGPALAAFGRRLVEAYEEAHRRRRGRSR